MAGTKRREFITLLIGAAAAWPLAVRAQQPGMRTIGFLHTGTRASAAVGVAGVLNGLREAAFVEGQNVAIYADGQYDRLPALAAELVRLPVAVLVAAGGEPSPLAAKAATSSIPIVFVIGSDPVNAGLVASYNRPGGNITGMNILTDAMEAKRLGLLHELASRAATIGFLTHPGFPSSASQVHDVEGAARAIGVAIRSLGLQLAVFDASTQSEIDAAFAGLVRHKVDALLINTDPFLLGQREQIVQLAARTNIPAMYFLSDFIDAGGLMSYGPKVANSYRQAGIYVGRILKGEKVRELPFVLPTRFDLVINLRSARALGLEIPTVLLIRADEVI